MMFLSPSLGRTGTVWGGLIFCVDGASQPALAAVSSASVTGLSLGLVSAVVAAATDWMGLELCLLRTTKELVAA